MKTALATFIALALAAIPAGARTQAQDAQPAPNASSAQLPPDQEDAVVEYGGPEPLTIVSGEERYNFMVEIANTPRSRTRGMMFRESVGEDAGMLFLYDQPRPASIWMKNTLIPLDIIYILPGGEIAKIAHNAVPGSLESLASGVPVLAVLELAGGRANALGLMPGDVVRHPAFGNTGDPTTPEGTAGGNEAADEEQVIESEAASGNKAVEQPE